MQTPGCLIPGKVKVSPTPLGTFSSRLKTLNGSRLLSPPMSPLTDTSWYIQLLICHTLNLLNFRDKLLMHGKQRREVRPSKKTKK